MTTYIIPIENRAYKLFVSYSVVRTAVLISLHTQAEFVKYCRFKYSNKMLYFDEDAYKSKLFVTNLTTKISHAIYELIKMNVTVCMVVSCFEYCFILINLLGYC